MWPEAFYAEMELEGMIESEWVWAEAEAIMELFIERKKYREELKEKENNLLLQYS